MLNTRRLDPDQLLRQAHLRLRLRAVEMSQTAKGARHIVVLAWFVFASLLRHQLTQFSLETLAEFLACALAPALTLVSVSLRLREMRLYAPVRPLADMRVAIESHSALRQLANWLMERAAQAQMVYIGMTGQIKAAISPLVNRVNHRLWALRALLRDLLPTQGVTHLAFAPQFVSSGAAPHRRTANSFDLFNLLC